MIAHGVVVDGFTPPTGPARPLAARFSSAKGDWATPQDLFDRLSRVYGPFDLDVCASKDNHKCSAYFDLEADGLSKAWAQRMCWMNPPYGRGIGDWMRKAGQEAYIGATVVCLVPARTDTKWFHTWVVPFATEIVFLPGRVKFGGAATGAPFPSAVVVYRPGRAPGQPVVRWGLPC